MGHINAGLEWLIQVFNDMWPLVLATFLGAWFAFHHHRHTEKRAALDARVAAVKHTLFVLSTQNDWLRQFNDNVLNLAKSMNDPALEMEPVTVHDDFPRLDMKSLPNVFENRDFHLLNEVTEAEQCFLEISRLLKIRANRLAALDAARSKGGDNRQRLEALEDGLSRVTKCLLEKAPVLLATNGVLLERLREYHSHQQHALPLPTVDYASWYVLAFSCAVAGVFFFSHWAVNSRSLIESGLDISLVSAVVFAVSLYSSLAVGILVAVLTIFSLIKRLKSFSVYFWTFIISVQPTVFLLWLEVA